MAYKPFIPYRYTLKPGASAQPPLAASSPEQPKALISGHREMNWLAYGWMILAIIISVFSLWAHLQIGLNNDQLIVMHEVSKRVAGDMATAGYTYANLLLLPILYTAPFLLSKAMGTPLHVCLYVGVYEGIALTLLLCESIVRNSNVSRNGRIIIVSSIAVALLGASFVYPLFADRDHLLLVMAAPWFLLYSPLAKRETIPYITRMVIAAMAAIAFAIAPYFYVFYLATLVFTLCRHPWREVIRQPEQHIVWKFALLYLIVLFSCFPHDVLTTLPLALQTYAAAWDWNSRWVIIDHELLSKFILPGFTATLVLLFAFPKTLDLTMAYMYVLLLAALASYALSSNGYYAQYPFIALSLVLGIAAMSKLVQAVSPIPFSVLRWACMLLAIIAVGGGLSYYFGIPIKERVAVDLKAQNRPPTVLTN